MDRTFDGTARSNIRWNIGIEQDLHTEVIPLAGHIGKAAARLEDESEWEALCVCARTYARASTLSADGSSVLAPRIPSNAIEAMQRPDRKRWQEMAKKNLVGHRIASLVRFGEGRHSELQPILVHLLAPIPCLCVCTSMQ